MTTGSLKAGPQSADAEEMPSLIEVPSPLSVMGSCVSPVSNRETQTIKTNTKNPFVDLEKPLMMPASRKSTSSAASATSAYQPAADTMPPTNILNLANRC